MSSAVPVKRVYISSTDQLPLDYGTTPGGTIFSTTPGGTKIVYDRAFLMKCRQSPLSTSLPDNLPSIPGVTSPDNAPLEKHIMATVPELNNEDESQQNQDDHQFQIEV